ncbi:hypothetical protein HMPREF0580_0450 [Mobiluncus mulieris ATCC 35239]|uniref:Uncharacterized protein n=1 Tax=Mobiluncus mulieris ATCC 35239 TaxID=871571 RepID=E0QNI6_9ACTO|nr:hypothetical protein HMPREF0580_0450 [Mobiluncus mulieris ATCC 35239]
MVSVEFGDAARDLGKHLMNLTLNFTPDITPGEVKCYVRWEVRLEPKKLTNPDFSLEYQAKTRFLDTLL